MTSFAQVADTLQTSPVSWSVRIDDVTKSGARRRAQSLLQVGADRELPTASVGKVLLLLTVADDIESGRLDPREPVCVRPEDRVADSGMLQHLQRQDLSLIDHAVLVGAVSDNLATNVLLRTVGLDRVHRTTAAIGLRRAALHDQVRDARGPQHPPFLSTSDAHDLVALVAGLHHGSLLCAPVCRRVVDWLRFDTDLSMVAGAFGLDPLCHWDADRGVRLWHKTGTNIGTRADCGVAVTPAGAVAYAAVARWAPQGCADPRREQVLAAMADIGRAIRAHLR